MRVRAMFVWCSRILVTLGCAVLLGATSRASGVAFEFEPVDFPGAALTVANGINAGGDIVGQYTIGGVSHGFVLSGGVYTSIDFPSADPLNPVTSTVARGIGPGGDIVGTYRLATEPTAVPAHGFLLTRSGTFYRADYPGHINTIPQRLLPDGTILGCYHDTNTGNTMFGMTIGRKGVSGFDMAMSMHNGATPDGKRIAGLWTDSANHGHAYLVEGDNFTSFDVPGSLSTAAWDMSARREIVGWYQDANRIFHGFLVDESWQFATVDVPGATATRIFGINSRGDVVGSYISAGVTHGFIGRRID